MTISEKVAYLKGLADGLDLQEKPSKEGKLIAKIIDILEDVGFAVEDLEVEVEALTDEVESVAEDLSDVETMVFEDWEDEDDEDACGGGCCCSSLDDDDFFEIECPSCGEDIVIDESILDIGEVTCPNCGDKFSMDLVDEAEAGRGIIGQETRNAPSRPGWGRYCFCLGKGGTIPVWSLKPSGCRGRIAPRRRFPGPAGQGPVG